MTGMVSHELRVTHRRSLRTMQMGDYAAPTNAEVEVECDDLIVAWEELISRLPAETCAALMSAVERIEKRGRQGA